MLQAWHRPATYGALPAGCGRAEPHLTRWAVCQQFGSDRMIEQAGDGSRENGLYINSELELEKESERARQRLSTVST